METSSPRLSHRVAVPLPGDVGRTNTKPLNVISVLPTLHGEDAGVSGNGNPVSSFCYRVIQNGMKLKAP